jgi:hypothetical protein
MFLNDFCQFLDTDAAPGKPDASAAPDTVDHDEIGVFEHPQVLGQRDVHPRHWPHWNGPPLLYRPRKVTGVCPDRAAVILMCAWTCDGHRDGPHAFERQPRALGRQVLGHAPPALERRSMGDENRRANQTA